MFKIEHYNMSFLNVLKPETVHLFFLKDSLFFEEDCM